MKKIAFIMFLITACVAELQSNVVHVAGNLRDIMMRGKSESVIDLQNLQGLENLYALGAVEHLDGEIMIWDGEPRISKVIDDSVVTLSTFKSGAALLVYAQVSKWKEVTVTDDLDLTSLQRMLQQAAEENQLSQPFPFLIRGEVHELSAHVITNASEGKHEHHDGFSLSIRNEPIELIGFYSDHHHGVFTHHGTNIHMHVRNKDKSLVGHVDDIKIKKQSVLLLPNEQ
jgi:alpha-acetolactate decarboxylase